MRRSRLRAQESRFASTVGEHSPMHRLSLIGAEPLEVKRRRKAKQLALEAEIADNLSHSIDRVQLESGGIRAALNLKRRIAEPSDGGGQWRGS